MKKGISNLPASINARLWNIAQKEGKLFQEVLQYYALERFLYRLSKSQHAPQFVLKGGLIFFGWRIELRRSTIDIDLAGQTVSSVNDMIQVIKEICDLPVQPDGMRFSAPTVQGEQIREQARYQGVRIRFTGFLGMARVAMRVDVGFQDEVVPKEIHLEYPTILDFPAPTLLGYTPESSIAEKLQIMAVLGSVNSRMKDYYDIWLLMQEVEFKGTVLQEAIAKTFRNRGTTIPTNAIIGLSDEFGRRQQTQWSAFLRRVSYPQDDIGDFPKVLKEIREFVQPVFEAARVGKPFRKTWKADRGWH